MESLELDIAFVNGLFESMYPRYHTLLPAQQAPGEGGVPPKMQCGEIDEEGWVRWRMLPSTINVQHLKPIEQELGVRLPQLMRAYLLAHHQMFSQFGMSSHVVSLPANPIEQPLESFLQFALAWKPLLSAGLLPFGDVDDGVGPCCLDLGASGMDDDFPAVWLDHERLLNLAPEDLESRAQLAPLINPLYPSFRALLTALFNGVRTEPQIDGKQHGAHGR